jgi:hypothetical protein
MKTTFKTAKAAFLAIGLLSVSNTSAGWSKEQVIKHLSVTVGSIENPLSIDIYEQKEILKENGHPGLANLIEEVLNYIQENNKFPDTKTIMYWGTVKHKPGLMIMMALKKFFQKLETELQKVGKTLEEHFSTIFFSGDFEYTDEEGNNHRVHFEGEDVNMGRQKQKANNRG